MAHVFVNESGETEGRCLRPHPGHVIRSMIGRRAAYKVLHCFSHPFQNLVDVFIYLSAERFDHFFFFNYYYYHYYFQREIRA